MRLLITGFEPFGRSSINPSQEAVKLLGADPPPGIEACTAVLPVDHRRGPEELLNALERTQPEAVVCLGEAGRRMRLSIERVGLNLVDDALPDNAGERWEDRPVASGGPAAYFVTLPVKAMLKAALEAGVPAELSLSAGVYLCNQTLYTLLHHLAGTGKGIPAGFIHLPLLPAQAAALQAAGPEIGPLPSMDLATQALGLRAALGVLARTTGL